MDAPVGMSAGRGGAVLWSRSTDMLGWVMGGAIMLAALVFCFRIMRRGMSTLDDDRRKFLTKIQDGEHKLREERKQVPAVEHLTLMRAAVEDLLRLEDAPPGYRVESAGRAILLHTPRGAWRLELAMREASLKTRRRVLHGRPRWFLSGMGQQEEHGDAASLMASLHAHLQTAETLPAEPPHLARRMGASRATPAARAAGVRPRGHA
ncbi:translation initiation factor IF-2 [Desulfovibrio sp.]|uniref:translation initiation factor IF-2 n=1 Tax=Desulfovibrio sp. TaxID=885 RepID=UPI0023BF8143|nr:translation initiation factor IF-2 [Desulfovibrio sp.]MDE7241848.1 translation initiation factor IF-2 [Desulfovibrio sp.]